MIGQPIEHVVVRGIPVRRVLRVSVLGAEDLGYRMPIGAYDDHLLGPDLLAELIIDAPFPSGALMDIIAIEFDRPLE